MRIICDCGNESIFNTTYDDGTETNVDPEEGQYCDVKNFDFWQQHDVVGVVCRKCGKALWMFT
jgi:hypothetical protein